MQFSPARRYQKLQQEIFGLGFECQRLRLIQIGQRTSEHILVEKKVNGSKQMN